jgi:hypothetical protein
MKGNFLIGQLMISMIVIVQDQAHIVTFMKPLEQSNDKDQLYYGGEN